MTYGPRWHDPATPLAEVAIFDPWPDNLPMQEQVGRLAAILMDFYPESFGRSEGAVEKAARLLWERTHGVGTADCCG